MLRMHAQAQLGDYFDVWRINDHILGFATAGAMQARVSEHLHVSLKMQDLEQYASAKHQGAVMLLSQQSRVTLCTRPGL